MRTQNSERSLVGPDNSATPFQALIQRVCNGDQAACEILVRDYGSVILREARLRLGSKFSSFLAAEDVLQSVLRSFLLRAIDGGFELREAPQLVRLLTMMARNKAFTALRREGKRRAIISHAEIADVPDTKSHTLETLEMRELLEIYRQRMGSQDWQLLQWRLDGYTWPQIARRLNKPANTLRKRLERALDDLRAALPLQ